MAVGDQKISCGRPPDACNVFIVKYLCFLILISFQNKKKCLCPQDNQKVYVDDQISKTGRPQTRISDEFS